MTPFFHTTKFRFIATSLLAASTITALVAYYSNTATTTQAASEQVKSSVAQLSVPEISKSYQAEVMEKARKISEEVSVPAQKIPLVQAFRSKVAAERTRFEKARNKLDEDVSASKSIEAQLSAAVLANNRTKIDDLNAKLEKSLATAQASGAALNETYKTYMNALQNQVDQIDTLASEK